MKILKITVTELILIVLLSNVLMKMLHNKGPGLITRILEHMI
jgi:hypothetical protein